MSDMYGSGQDLTDPTSGWLAGLLNRWGVDVGARARGLVTGQLPGTPAPIAPVAPPATPPLPPLQVPQVGGLPQGTVTQRRVPVQPQTFDFPVQPPPPPPMNIPSFPTLKPEEGGFDPTRARELLSQADPRNVFDPSLARKYLSEAEPRAPGTENAMVDVLGGLARGAAGVDPTRPGSFAAALAGAGAGGAEARGAATRRELEREQQYEQQRGGFKRAQAEQELGISREAQAEQRATEARRIQQAQIELQISEYEDRIRSAKSSVANEQAVQAWKGGIESAKLLQDDAYKRRDMSAPQVHISGNTASYYDPGTGKVGSYDVRGEIEKYATAIQNAKAIGGPGGESLAAARQVQMLAGDTSLEPHFKIQKMKDIAMAEIMEGNHAPAVFGTKAYNEAIKYAQKQMEPYVGASVSKPEWYRAQMNSLIAARLRENMQGSDKWVYDAAPYSIAAGSMTGSRALNTGE